MLDPSKLKDGLLQLSRSFPASPVEAAKGYAAAYASYSAAATSPIGGAPVAVAAAQTLLGTSLVAAFAGADPATASAVMATAFTSFWLLPPMVFSGTPPGAVTLVVGTPALPAALVAAWAANLAAKAEAAEAAQRLANAFDLFTKTVVVLHPVVPTPVLGPIT